MTDRPQLAALFTWRSAIAQSDLTPTLRHVALTLALYMNERGGSAYPGVNRLAKDTGLHRTTVMRALEQLTAMGWLTLLEHGQSKAGKPRRASVYEARIPPADLFGPVAHDDRSHRATGRSERCDRSGSATRPVAQCDPISSENSSLNADGGKSLGGVPVCVAAGWAPTPEDLTWARRRGYSRRQVDVQAERFALHAQAHDRRFVDVSAGWRKWLSHDEPEWLGDWPPDLEDDLVDVDLIDLIDLEDAS